jgi:hypothetical protein
VCVSSCQNWIVKESVAILTEISELFHSLCVSGSGHDVYYVFLRATHLLF